MRIAFDIDGVFSPDFNLHDGYKVNEMLRARQYIKPFFEIPRKLIPIWYGITGRPESDSVETYNWFICNTIHPPELIFFNDLGMNESAIFKANVITYHCFDAFVESDENQANLIKERCKHTKVYTMQQVIEIGLNNILELK